MQITGEQTIAAPRDKVWAALNDPQVLKAAIPGCETLQQKGDDCYSAVVVAKIGPVRAKFNGRATLSNVQAPERYTISGEGGGVAGLAKGAADVRLEKQGDRTLLHYAVRADVGGKLAQVGSRLLESTAKRYANDFFARFDDVVTGKAPVEAPAEVAAAPRPEAAVASPVAAAAPSTPRGADDPNVVHLRRLNWALLGIVALLALAFLIQAW